MLALARRRPAFGRLLLAHAASRAGDAFHTVALVVLVFDLTGSALGAAGIVVFEVVPVLLLGPVAGALVDRYPRRRVLVVADVTRAALVGLLAVSHGSVALAYASAFGLAVGSLAFNPASASVVPDSIEVDEVVEANAALWTVAVAIQVVLAPVAGVAVAALGVGTAFGLNAASYFASAALLHHLPVGRVAAAAAVRGWQGVTAGWAVVRAHPLLVRLATVQVLASLSAGATGGLLVVLAAERRTSDPGASVSCSEPSGWARPAGRCSCAGASGPASGAGCSAPTSCEAGWTSSSP